MSDFKGNNVTKISGKSLGTTLATVLLVFIVIFKVFFPIDYSDESVEMNWLSASTIIFVNQWLEEGASTNRFTCYMSFDSIELPTLADRQPYVSYPVGTVFSVYLAARLCGVSHIDLPFVKIFQMGCYALDALFWAAFIYILLSMSLEIREIGKIAFSVILSVMWIVLPINVYFLANVFWSDQYVILWVHLFLLLELISGLDFSKREALIINILKIPVIIMGMLTDYYFWIVVFFAFVLKVGKYIIEKKKPGETVKVALWYICPVAFSLIAFIWQLSYTPNWLELLSDRFFARTGSEWKENVYLGIWQRFDTAFLSGSEIRLGILILMVLSMMGMLLHQLIIKKKWKSIFVNPSYSIITLGFVATFFQIFFLKNHSADHEFPMIKVGWIMIMMVIALELLLQKEKEFISVIIAGKKVPRIFLECMILLAGMMMTLGMPNSTRYYYNTHRVIADLRVANVLYDIMDYEDVCFSFTYKAEVYPPQKLSVSEKHVYLIEDANEIDTYFPDLSEEARINLVIEKDNPYKTDEISEKENALLEEGIVIYEDEACYIVRLNNN